METSFVISLGITFVLLLLLIYHFKQRLSIAESKQDTMFEIINNLAQELNNMKMSLSLIDRPPTPYPHDHISNNGVSIHEEMKNIINENMNNDEYEDSHSESEYESCSDSDSDSDDDDDKIIVSDEDDNEDNISVEEIRPSEDVNEKSENLVIEILENIQTNTQEPETLDTNELKEAKVEKTDFSKMNLGALKSYIIEQGWVQDASKMKKAQILSLIQEHQ